MLKRLKPILLWSALSILLVAATVSYLHYRSLHPSTDDAYVRAHTIYITAQTSGPVLTTNIHNHMAVKTGQLLLSIDPQSYLIAVQRAQAELRLTKDTIRSKENAIVVAEANVSEKQANLAVTEKNTHRTLLLAQHGRAPAAAADKANSLLIKATAGLRAAQSQLAAARNNLAVSTAAKDVKKTALAQAHLNLQHTKIYAPHSGRITQFNLLPGSMISARQNLFALVETQEWWVDANFKETDLSRIRPGQNVKVVLDMYPKHIFHGVVTHVNIGSGSAFSLFPPENATGNWVKVTQRFPVQIKIKDPTSNFPLRIGASASVSIDT